MVMDVRRNQHPPRADPELKDFRARYSPPADALDEALAAPPSIRHRYAGLLGALESRDPVTVRDRVQERMGSEGVCFRTAHGHKPFRVDPIPRLLGDEEWSELERGLVQRARALEAFVADAYGDQRIVAAGELPERVLTSSALFDPAIRGLQTKHYVYVYGPDVVRDERGRLLVLEDNLRTPSGIAYLLAIRDAVIAELGTGLDDVRELDPRLREMRECLREAAPAGVPDPALAVLTDGTESPAFYEHCEIARRLGVALVTLSDLEATGKELYRRDEEGRRRRVDVIYRRTDEAGFTASGGGLTDVARKLAEPIAAGTLGIANAFGVGIGDDKLVHAYAERMIRFYLGEEPLLRSVKTFDLGDEPQREEAIERVQELVVKERHRAGGNGVIVEPDDEPMGAEGVREMLERREDGLVAQERVEMSTHPTVGDDGIEPRRIDLRPFILRTATGWAGLPGGLTRFAPSADSLVVNSTQGGGGKDTWVVRRRAGA